MTAAAILGLGEHRPARVVSNDELAATLETDDEWIRTRTGIRSRRIAGTDESVVTMASDAAAKAVAAAGVDAAAVDLVILATCTLPTPVPGGAARVARAIGASKAGGYDVNAACAGFCYGVAAAADAVRAGSARTVVVIGSEKLSDWTDWTDRSSAILFGDGAGAAVVGAATDGVDAIGRVVWGTDGAAADLISTGDRGKLRLDGPAVFRWATTTLGPVVDAAAQQRVLEYFDLGQQDGRPGRVHGRRDRPVRAGRRGPASGEPADRLGDRARARRIGSRRRRRHRRQRQHLVGLDPPRPRRAAQQRPGRIR